MITFIRKAAAVSLLAAAVLAVSACGDKKDAETAAAPAVNDKSSFEDKASYSVGASVGTYLKKMSDSQKEFVKPFNQELVLQGFADAYKGKSVLDDKQIEETLRTLDTKIKDAMDAKAKAEAQKNREDGKKFLEENQKKDGVKVTKSGLQYKVLTEGKGANPKDGDTVSVTYKGTTIDGKVFDEQQKPVEFPLENMIPGWIEGLKLMTPGSEYELYLPADLGYGEAGAGETIAPNSVLIFDVKLVEINPKHEDKADDKAKDQKDQKAEEPKADKGGAK